MVLAYLSLSKRIKAEMETRAKTTGGVEVKVKAAKTSSRLPLSSLSCIQLHSAQCGVPSVLALTIASSLGDASTQMN
jgi:hypothetical protein